MAHGPNGASGTKRRGASHEGHSAAQHLWIHGRSTPASIALRRVDGEVVSCVVLIVRWLIAYSVHRTISGVRSKLSRLPLCSGNPLYHHCVGFQSGTHYPFTWDDLWITKFRALIPFAASPTCHNKHVDLGNFEVFFLARSVGHASACAMFRGFSQRYKALQSYRWSMI